MIFFGMAASVLGIRARSEADVVKRLTDEMSRRAAAYAGIDFVETSLRPVESQSKAAASAPVSLKKTSAFWKNNPKVFEKAALFNGSEKFLTVGYPSMKEKSGEAFVYGLDDLESDLNINTVSVDVLAQIYARPDDPLAGHAKELAAETVKWRERKAEFAESGQRSGTMAAGFGSVEELLLVPGMSYALWAKLRPYLTVYGNGKVNLNTVGAETLALLGLDDGLVRRIMEYRISKLQAQAETPEEPFKDLGDLEQKIGVSPEEEKELQNFSSLWGFESETFRFMALEADPAPGKREGYECIINRKGELLSLKAARA